MIFSSTRWRRPVAALAAAAALGIATLSQANLPEQQLKAAFVLNFVRYVEWPERALGARDAPIMICVFGRDAIESALSDLGGRQVHGRTVRIRTGAGIDDSEGCHVAFITEAESRRLVPILRSLAGRPVLTVSDIDDFIDSGGAIGIVNSDNRLQFEINRAALAQGQLKASSQLLKLARAVLNAGP